jgi:hypothetical protein
MTAPNYPGPPEGRPMERGFPPKSQSLLLAETGEFVPALVATVDTASENSGPYNLRNGFRLHAEAGLRVAPGFGGRQNSTEERAADCHPPRKKTDQDNGPETQGKKFGWRAL